MSLRVVILSPVMPIWDHGVFCSSFTKRCLAKGFQITLLDTLSLFPTHSSFGNNSALGILPFMIEKLEIYFREPSILVGFSMAGMLVQILAARLPNIRAVLAVNAPGYPDMLLQRRVGYILNFLKNKDLSGALEALNAFMHPRGVMKKRALWEIPEAQKSMAIERMTKGFEFLLGMDARNEIIKYTGKFLALVGEKSQLATVDNQTRSHCVNHEYKIVSDAGTRLWDDNPAMTNAILDEWIERL
ncbi:alpha/beta fold hydrolase [Bartonella vinsonii]|uniref:Alpha/beta hydrolase family n=1 Tax=Bartonella vinsonii TaxID=33047 RepID=A0A3S4ZDB8_BARVI|nr:alpha/beta hydrolase [Bartonella vinsonii]VEJ45820.1 Alpha/beta hydrolase family [Bartonella vinsonii]